MAISLYDHEQRIKDFDGKIVSLGDRITALEENGTSIVVRQNVKSGQTITVPGWKTGMKCLGYIQMTRDDRGTGFQRIDNQSSASWSYRIEWYNSGTTYSNTIYFNNGKFTTDQWCYYPFYICLVFYN